MMFFCLLLTVLLLFLGREEHCHGFRYHSNEIKSKSPARMWQSKLSDAIHRKSASLRSSADDDTEALAKLKAEAASPFRLLRQFIYGAMAAGGGVGTVTTIPQLIIALQDDSPSKVEVIKNIAIDAGAVVAAIALWKQDSDKAQVQLEKFKDKQAKVSNQMTKEESSEREKNLSLLPVEIQVNERDENVTRIYSLADLQSQGKQNVVIITGKEKFVKDAVISARLEGNDLFNAKDTMVIPFIVGAFENQLEATPSKGFGTKETLMTAPYIAKAQQPVVWDTFMAKEIELAESQGTKNAADTGVVLAIRNDGKIVLRGVGMPPWKSVVEEFKK